MTENLHRQVTAVPPTCHDYSLLFSPPGDCGVIVKHSWQSRLHTLILKRQTCDTFWRRSSFRFVLYQEKLFYSIFFPFLCIWWRMVNLPTPSSSPRCNYFLIRWLRTCTDKRLQSHQHVTAFYCLFFFSQMPVVLLLCNHAAVLASLSQWS